MTDLPDAERRRFPTRATRIGGAAAVGVALVAFGPSIRIVYLGLALVLTIVLVAAAILTRSKEPIGRQELEIVVPFPVARVSVFAEDALKALPGATIADSRGLPGFFEADVSGNWFSFGERVAIKIERIGEDSSRVELSSTPSIPQTVVDFGRNSRNLRRLRERLVATIR